MSWWVKFFLIIFIAIITGGGTLVYKGLSLERNISIPTKESSLIKQIQELVNLNSNEPKQELPEEINILLLGIPGKGHNGAELTDSILVLMARPRENKAVLLSIPRDFYVKIPDLDLGYSRINAVYTYGNEYKYEGGGIELLKKTIENVTNIRIDNYIVMDFTGFVDLVDTLEGIEIDNKEDIYDTAYPGENFTYQTFKLKKGKHVLDGDTALKYVRTRHSFGGDFDRVRRQHEVLQILKEKTLDLNPVFDINKINKIINTLGEHIKTDLSITQIKSLYELQKKDWQIASSFIDANPETGVLLESKELLGNAQADVLKPRLGVDNHTEIKEFIENIFALDAWKEKQRNLRTEKATVEIRYSPKDFNNESLNSLTKELSNFGYQTNSQVLKVGEINNSPEETTIYDFTKGTKPYSLEDLKDKLGAKTSVPIGNLNSTKDFVVILKTKK